MFCEDGSVSRTRYKPIVMAVVPPCHVILEAFGIYHCFEFVTLFMSDDGYKLVSRVPESVTDNGCQSYDERYISKRSQQPNDHLDEHL